LAKVAHVWEATNLIEYDMTLDTYLDMFPAAMICGKIDGSGNYPIAWLRVYADASSEGD
jgi:hypothetical protein